MLGTPVQNERSTQQLHALSQMLGLPTQDPQHKPNVVVDSRCWPQGIMNQQAMSLLFRFTGSQHVWHSPLLPFHVPPVVPWLS